MLKTTYVAIQTQNIFVIERRVDYNRRKEFIAYML